MQLFNTYCNSSYGPMGTLKLVRLGNSESYNCDAIFYKSSHTLLFPNARANNAVSSSSPAHSLFHKSILVNILLQSSSVQVRQFGDHGLYTCALASGIYNTMANESHTPIAIDAQVVSNYNHQDALNNNKKQLVLPKRINKYKCSIIEVACGKCASLVEQYFSSQFLSNHVNIKQQQSIGTSLSFAQHLTLVSITMLQSKHSLLGFISNDEVEHVAQQVVKAWINALPQPTPFNIRIAKINNSYRNTRVLEDNTLLIEEPLAPEIAAIITKHNSKTLNTTHHVIVYECGLDFDTIFASSSKKTNSIKIGKRKAILQFITKLKDKNIRIVASQKVIHPLIKHLLVSNDIIPLERLSLRHVDLFKHLCQCELIKQVDLAVELLDELSIGLCKSITSVSIGDKQYVQFNNYIDACIVVLIFRCSFLQITGSGAAKQQPITTLLLTCKSLLIFDEYETIVRAILQACTILAKNPKVVPGAGATELALYNYIMQQSQKEPKHNLRNCMQDVALCIRDMALQLVSNKLDRCEMKQAMLMQQHDTITWPKLKSNCLHNISHDNSVYGFDSLTGKIEPIRGFAQADILATITASDVLVIKQSAILSAIDTACMLLRIDD